jgi:hypothetical protein
MNQYRLVHRHLPGAVDEYVLQERVMWFTPFWYSICTYDIREYAISRWEYFSRRGYAQETVIRP